MPQIKTQFTPEEKKAFEEKYNLGVYNHESLVEVLMQLKEQNKQQDELLSHYINRVIKLEERLMEVASGVPIGLCETESPSIRRNSLADKWK